jgi:hypothetical protein
MYELLWGAFDTGVPINHRALGCHDDTAGDDSCTRTGQGAVTKDVIEPLSEALPFSREITWAGT